MDELGKSMTIFFVVLFVSAICSVSISRCYDESRCKNNYLQCKKFEGPHCDEWLRRCVTDEDETKGVSERSR